MQDSGLSVGWARSEKEVALLERACMPLPCVHHWIAHHLLSFGYVCGSIFVRNRPSYPIESVFVYVVGEISSAEGGDTDCHGGLCHCSSNEDVRHFVSYS